MSSRTRRPTRYNDDTLVVGIDIAKDRQVAVAEGPKGITTKPLTFNNDQKGFEQFSSWLIKTMSRFGTTAVVIGMEPTGHYWKPLGEWLQGQGYELRFVSTVLTKRAKDMLDGSPLKTDAKDAAVIADLVRQGKSRPQSPHQEIYQELRYLAELRQRLVIERSALLNRLHRLLDLLFPELPKLFSCLDLTAVFTLLQTAPTPQDVMTLGLDALTNLLQRASRKRLGQDRAQAILDAAFNSIGCRNGQQALQLELTLLLPRIGELTKQRKQVETQMAEALQKIDYAKGLLSIPSIGIVTAAIVLGELGDLRLYSNARQVLKMAGLNLFERSSGHHQGQRHITKRGRTQLRQVLYMATIRLVAPGQPLHELKQKMTPSKPGPKIIVAGMRRLLRTMFAITRDQHAFDPQRFAVRPAMLAQPTGLAA
jgi:transposase